VRLGRFSPADLLKMPVTPWVEPDRNIRGLLLRGRGSVLAQAMSLSDLPESHQLEVISELGGMG